MAFAVVNFPAMIMSSSKYRSRQKLLQVRAQRYEDEGKSRHVVDANLQILRRRIEEVKMKERVGWNYRATTNYDKKQKKELDYITHCVGVLCMVGGTIGFTILSCTLRIYLTSLLIH